MKEEFEKPLETRMKSEELQIQPRGARFSQPVFTEEKSTEPEFDMVKPIEAKALAPATVSLLKSCANELHDSESESPEAFTTTKRCSPAERFKERESHEKPDLQLLKTAFNNGLA
jgi:hypothetical protein